MSSLDKINQILSKGITKTSLVYDKYKSADFSYGSDNLNPKREMEAIQSGVVEQAGGEAFSILDDLKNELYIAYKDRVAELRALAEAARAEESSKATSASEVGAPYEDTTEIQVTTSITNQPPTNPDSYVSKYDSVLDMLGKLDNVLEDEVISLEDFPFDLCSDRSIPGGIIAPAHDNTVNGSSGESSSSTNTGGSGDSSTGSSDTGGSDISGSGSGSSSGDSDTETENPSDDAEKNCLQIQLEVAQMLHTWMEIITLIQKMVSTIMSILAPVLEIASLIGGCWVNPAALGEMVQKIAATAIAHVLDLLTQIINTLIKMSGLECSINELLATGRDIMSVTNGAIDAGSEVFEFVTLTNPEISGALTEIAAVGAAVAGTGAGFVTSVAEGSLGAKYSQQWDSFYNSFTDGLTDDIKKQLINAGLDVADPYITAAENAITLAEQANNAANRVTDQPKKAVKVYKEAGSVIQSRFEEMYEAF